MVCVMTPSSTMMYLFREGVSKSEAENSPESSLVIQSKFLAVFLKREREKRRNQTRQRGRAGFPKSSGELKSKLHLLVKRCEQQPSNAQLRMGEEMLQ